MAVPTPPTDLTPYFNNGVISLSWNYLATEGITSFKVYRGESSGTETLLLSGYSTPPFYIDTATLASFQDLTPVNGTTYFYTVKAHNASGDSAASSEVSSAAQDVTDGSAYVSTDWNAEEGLAADTLIAGRAYSVDQVWTNTEDSVWTAANGYDVIATDNTTLTNAGRRFLLTEEPSEENDWRGTFARDIVAPSVAGDNYIFETGVAQEFVKIPGVIGSVHSITVTVLPETPTDLAAASGCGTVSLSWTAALAATGYNIYRAPAGGEYALVGTSPTTSYDDDSALPVTTYAYKVAATAGDLESVLSSATSVTLGPDPPTGLTATPACAGNQLEWDVMDCADGYNVYCAPSAGADYELLDTVLAAILPFGATTVSYLDASAPRADSTYYKVTSLASDRETDYSAVVSATRTGPPNPPTGLIAYGKDGKVLLKWTAGEATTARPVATIYYIYRGTAHVAPETTYTQVSGVLIPPGPPTLDDDLIGTSVTLSFVDVVVDNGTTYYYRVAGGNACGEGDKSAEASGTPNCCQRTPQRPTPPTGTYQRSRTP
jgi:hypothetical protein